MPASWDPKSARGACGSCRWWRRSSLGQSDYCMQAGANTDDFSRDFMRECHRHPPTVMQGHEIEEECERTDGSQFVLKHGWYGVFPSTYEDDGCGEWEPWPAPRRQPDRLRSTAEHLVSEAESETCQTAQTATPSPTPPVLEAAPVADAEPEPQTCEKPKIATPPPALEPAAILAAVQNAAPAGPPSNRDLERARRLEKAEQEGRDTAEFGDGEDTCPYDESDNRRASWLKGWHEASKAWKERPRLDGDNRSVHELVHEIITKHGPLAAPGILERLIPLRGLHTNKSTVSNVLSQHSYEHGWVTDSKDAGGRNQWRAGSEEELAKAESDGADARARGLDEDACPFASVTDARHGRWMRGFVNAPHAANGKP